MKKMTKEEAFVFLRNSKVRVTPEESKKIQEIAFKAGFEWTYSIENVQHENAPYLFFGMVFMTQSKFLNTFKSLDYKLLFPEEILEIEIEEDKPKFTLGELVLVREDNEAKWCIDHFAYYDEGYGTYQTFGGYDWNYCIPYKGNEDKLGEI